MRNDGATIWVRVRGIPEFEDDICKRVFGIIQGVTKGYIDEKTIFTEIKFDLVKGI